MSEFILLFLLLVSTTALASTAQVNSVAQPGLGSAAPAAIVPMDRATIITGAAKRAVVTTLTTTTAVGTNGFANFIDFSNDRTYFVVAPGKSFQILSYCSRTIGTAGPGCQIVISDICPVNAGTTEGLNSLYSSGAKSVYNFLPSNTAGEEECTTFYALIRAGKCIATQCGAQSAGGVRLHGIYE